MINRSLKIYIAFFALTAFGQSAVAQAATHAPNPVVAISTDKNVVLVKSGEAEPNEMDALLAALVGNQFGLTKNDLKFVANPKGIGFFIYVKRTTFGGAERKFIWFANSGIVTALNGATKSATPSLLFPREVSEDHLKATQHGPHDITGFALNLLF